ncbi:VanZ family protein [Bacillus sp. B190/17]|uniref:VanZ family protein n=1 Tax=Bacillus lumedeiriae TaxID=3058829 RepID=A0ABW8I7W4_9BACI
MYTSLWKNFCFCKNRYKYATKQERREQEIMIKWLNLILSLRWCIYLKKLARGLSTIAPLLYMAAVWIMSSMPANAIIELPQSDVDRFFKESLHLIEFAILYSLIVIAFLANGRLTNAVHVAAALIACFYGLIDEIHQAFVPFRSATVIDAVKDVTGVLICFLIVQFTYFTRPHSPISRLMYKFTQWASS